MTILPPPHHIYPPSTHPKATTNLLGGQGVVITQGVLPTTPPLAVQSPRIKLILGLGLGWGYLILVTARGVNKAPYIVNGVWVIIMHNATTTTTMKTMMMWWMRWDQPIVFALISNHIVHPPPSSHSITLPFVSHLYRSLPLNFSSSSLTYIISLITHALPIITHYSSCVIVIIGG